MHSGTHDKDNKMSKRQLSDVDIAFIEKKYVQMSAGEIASGLPSGIGEKTVQKYIDNNLEPQMDDPLLSGRSPHPLPAKKKSKTAGDAIEHYKGSTVMTQTASEISDARKTHNVQPLTDQQKSRRKDFIHQPFGE